MDVNQVLSNISERQKKISALTDVERNIILDIGNLTAWDPESITIPKSGNKRESVFKELARNNVQVILNQLYSINDTEVIDGQRMLKLPEPTTILPRSRPIPTPKPPTKWERFAREKGIKSKSSKNRDKLNYDDTTQKWIPRHGYRRAENEQQKDWLIEIPDQADPNVDYFAKKVEEKKERIAKNKFQHLRNIAARS